MMGYGMMGFFPIIFMIIYLVAVAYFFYLLASISKSITRIADRLDKCTVEIKQNNDVSDMR